MKGPLNRGGAYIKWNGPFGVPVSGFLFYKTVVGKLFNVCFITVCVPKIRVIGLMNEKI